MATVAASMALAIVVLFIVVSRDVYYNAVQQCVYLFDSAYRRFVALSGCVLNAIMSFEG